MGVLSLFSNLYVYHLTLLYTNKIFQLNYYENMKTKLKENTYFFVILECVFHNILIVLSNIKVNIYLVYEISGLFFCNQIVSVLMQ